MFETKALTVFVVIIFISSSRGVILNCDFYMVDWAIDLKSTIGNLYTCTTATDEASGNYTALVDVRGAHSQGRTNKDVQGLSVWNQVSYFQIPRNIESFFPNLVGLAFWSGIFTSITADDLKPFPSLKLLDLSHNKLVTLDGDLFKHTPKIQAIYFFDNLITDVGNDLLTGLTDLKAVDFEDNTCISFQAYSPAAIESLKTELRLRCSTSAATTPKPTTSSFSITSIDKNLLVLLLCVLR